MIWQVVQRTGGIVCMIWQVASLPGAPPLYPALSRARLLAVGATRRGLSPLHTTLVASPTMSARRERRRVVGFRRHGPGQHEVQGEEPWGVARRSRPKEKSSMYPFPGHDLEKKLV